MSQFTDYLTLAKPRISFLALVMAANSSTMAKK